MKKDIMKCFALEGVLVDSLKVEEDVVIKIRSPRTDARCPNCLKSTKSVHDSKRRKIVHGMMNGRKVILDLLVRRFKCKCRSNPFTEGHPPGITGKRHTERFDDGVIKALMESNFRNAANAFKTSSPTVLAIAKGRQKSVSLPEGGIVLNIDEHSYRGRDMKTSVGAANHRKMLAVLPDDRKSTLVEYLNSWPSEAKKRVAEACIDMKMGYFHAIRESLPHVRIVIDHFHVVREMNRQVDETRRIIQDLGAKGERRIDKLLLLKGREKLTPSERMKLDRIFKTYEKYATLRHAYFVKEKVREMYASPNRKEAERKFDMLLSQLEGYEVGKLSEMRDTLLRWKPYILNYFENKTTNAFIEGCHNKIKLVKRLSYGFRNLENYILRITLAFAPLLFASNFHTNL